MPARNPEEETPLSSAIEVGKNQATGPFCGHRVDQFVVHFDMDVTNKPSGQRMRLNEVGLYTIKNGKVVQEEFLYLTA